MHVNKEKYNAFCPDKYMLQKNICLSVDKSWKCGSQVDIVSFVKAKSFLSDVYFVSTFFRGSFSEVFQNNFFIEHFRATATGSTTSGLNFLVSHSTKF